MLAQSADLLLLNANVVTLDAQHPRAQAVAVAGERIVWVGTTAEARRRFANAARVVDLHGATVLPGLIDVHTHLLNLGQSLLRLNLKDVKTPAEAAARVRERAAKAKSGEWILGWGWDEGAWAANYPTTELLDSAAPENPVWLSGLHGFAGWGNRRALSLASVTKETQDPENGKLVRDAQGQPSGVLLNRAQELVTRKIPPLTLEQTKAAIARGAQECVAHGLTELHEASVTPLMLQAYRELIREGKMPVRLQVMLDGANAALVNEWLGRGPEIDRQHWLTVRTIKLFADGALGSRGAAMLEPYSDAPQTKGVVTTPEEKIYDVTRRALERGFQVATHAIGDAANRFTLDAYERALKEVPAAKDARLRVEHAQVLAPADIPRFARLGVIASMQPPHATSDMTWAEKRVGPERIRGAYAWRSVLKTGAHLPLSSDFPGESLDPFYGMYAAVTRQDPQGHPVDGWLPEQRLTINEALRGYTVEAAYAGFEENDKGTIATGKLADFTLVAQDITKAVPRELLNARVIATYVGGKQVFPHPKI